MFRIRPMQISAFRKNRNEKYIRELVKYITKRYPEVIYKYSNEDVEKKIRKYVDIAKSYDFETAYQLTQFVELVFDLDCEFYKKKDYEWVLKAFKYKNATLDQKVQALWETIYSVPPKTYQADDAYARDENFLNLN